MRKTFLISALLIGVAIVPAHARPWVKGDGQGMMEYHEDTGPKDKTDFTISCDVGASEVPGSKTAILIDLGGGFIKNTPANLYFDGITDAYVVKIDEHGLGHTDTHKAFARIWAKLRTSQTLRVVLPNGEFADFDTRGARKVLEPKACASNT